MMCGAKFTCNKKREHNCEESNNQRILFWLEKLKEDVNMRHTNAQMTKEEELKRVSTENKTDQNKMRKENTI